jgi:hypothetical protein
VRKALTLEDYDEIIKSNPKDDTIYVDSTGHTWYIYVEHDGTLVIYNEPDSTESDQ